MPLMLRLGLLVLLLAPGLAVAQQTIRPGETASGSLGAGDAVLTQDQTFYDLFVVRAAPGEELEITMRSGDFDAYLIGGPTRSGALAVTEDTNDDDGGETDAQLVVTASPAGEYWVLANVYDAEGSGRYTLSVRSLGGGAPASGSLRAGQTVSGSLSPGDEQLPDGSYADVYTYKGTPGETITVSLASGEFDAYLSGGRMENGRFVQDASDDDGGDGTDARLVAEVGYSGRYTIRANSLGAGETGAYTLSVTSESGDGLVGATDLRPGESADGRLEAGDPTLDDGSPYDFYAVSASPYEALEITLASGDFDAYLVGGATEDGAFGGELRDDDGGGGTDAQLRVQAGADGQYFVLANALRADMRGGYTLSVRSVDGGDAPDSGLPTLAIGQTVTGELSGDDAMMDDGTHFDVYTFQGTPGEEVEISLSSDDFDTYLLLRRYFGGELENVAEDDDGGAGTDSRIRTTLDGSGTYVIGANTFTAGATGRYTLTLSRPDGSAPDAGTSLPALLTGQSVEGVLDPSDLVLADTSYADLYVYRGNPGDRVAVTLRSAAFDAYLAVATVEGENLEVIGRDDDGAGGTDSRVEFAVGGSGVYAVQANSFTPRSTGAYSLVVERVTGPAPVANEGNARFLGKWSPASYEPTSTYSEVREEVRSGRRLESIVNALNEDFPLPRNVPVAFEECGMINAQYRYRGMEGQVRFCYELMEYIEGVLAQQVEPARLAEAVSGAYEFIMLHEAGHALRHQLDLPITGREEDVADQFAALTLIRQGNKGARAAIDGVLALQNPGGDAPAGVDVWAGEHSLGPVRLYNVVCLVYGSDPDKYASLVGEGGLPEARAVRCPGEYAQVEKSFDRLLGLVYGE